MVIFALLYSDPVYASLCDNIFQKSMDAIFIKKQKETSKYIENKRIRREVFSDVDSIRKIPLEDISGMTANHWEIVMNNGGMVNALTQKQIRGLHHDVLKNDYLLNILDKKQIRYLSLSQLYQIIIYRDQQDSTTQPLWIEHLSVLQKAFMVQVLKLGDRVGGAPAESGSELRARLYN